VTLAHRAGRGLWRACGDLRVGALASGVALVTGVAGYTGAASTTLAPWVGIGLGIAGLVGLGYAIASGGGR
jgi:hypothetical protein